LPSSCSLYASRAPRVLYSFPTRRSSDLVALGIAAATRAGHTPHTRPSSTDTARAAMNGSQVTRTVNAPVAASTMLTSTPTMTPRSEEHTSELQSRENLVCRLLLEKKKTQ